jgi:hypothetical protein
MCGVKRNLRALRVAVRAQVETDPKLGVAVYKPASYETLIADAVKAWTTT